MAILTEVISGHGRGKEMGFPTLNLVIPKSLTDKHGIYAGWVWIDTKKYQGAFHFGPIPTFQDPQPSLEVYLLNTDIDIPPTQIEFELVQFLREIRNFDSVDQLVKQIALDVESCKNILK